MWGQLLQWSIAFLCLLSILSDYWTSQGDKSEWFIKQCRYLSRLKNSIHCLSEKWMARPILTLLGVILGITLLCQQIQLGMLMCIPPCIIFEIRTHAVNDSIYDFAWVFLFVLSKTEIHGKKESVKTHHWLCNKSLTSFIFEHVTTNFTNDHPFHSFKII